MISKRIIAPLVIVIILSGIGGVFTAKTVTKNRIQQTDSASNIDTMSTPSTQTTDPNPVPEPQQTSQSLPGRYTSYSSEKAAEAYPETILFFYAAWCPECRAFKQAITSEAIPENIQILEVNYDNETDLKKKYGVTVQTTFVKTNSNGDQLGKWVGYGREKGLNVVLENL